SLFGILNVKAQDLSRKIEWQPNPKTFTTVDGKTVKQLTFKNAFHSESEGLIPVYSERIALPADGKVTAQIVNPVFSPADNFDRAAANKIKESVEVTSEISYYKKRPQAYVEFVPFRKNTAGQIEKLESFTLRLSVQPAPQHRSTNAYAANSVL